MDSSSDIFEVILQQFFMFLGLQSQDLRFNNLGFHPTCHFSPPPPDTELVIVCFSVSSCFFLFLSTASGFLTPLYAVSFCLFSAASASCRLLVSGSGVTTTSSAAPPRHGKHIPILVVVVPGRIKRRQRWKNKLSVTTVFSLNGYVSKHLAGLS